MKTALCEMFGIEAPIVAFSHCRNVVVEASKAGGLGMFGADTYSPEELAVELQWIEDHIGGRPYGVDVLFPVKYEDVSTKTDADPYSLIPREHQAFVDDLLERHGVPHLPGDEERKILEDRLKRGRSTPAFSNALLDVAFSFPGVRAIVSAIGTPPPGVIERAHAKGIKVGAMIGQVKHAIRQRDAGVDFVVAQGYEAGGHTGEITSMVLVPEVVDAVAPLPVLAAGGVGRGRQLAAALALGAEGVWCGSVWLTTAESDATPEVRQRLLKAGSRDTVITKSFTGKNARFLKSAWTEAWEAEGAPKPLMRPYQHFLRAPAFERIDRYRAVDLVSSPAGQIAGSMNHESTVRQVFFDMLSEFADTQERLGRIVGSGG